MAWHWRRDGDVPFELFTRVGDDRPDVFRAFLARHAIPHTPELVAPGPSSSIDIVIQPDLQPYMDHFVEGVWADYALSPAELERVRAAGRLHLVLVEGAIRELERRPPTGRSAGVEVTRRLPRLPPLHARAGSRRRCGPSMSGSSAGRAPRTTRASGRSATSRTTSGGSWS